MSLAQPLPQPGWLERREHAAFRYRKRSRTVVDTAEEAYLRVDIPCGAGAVCAACPPTAPALALLDGPLALGAFAAADGAAQAPPPHLLLPDAGTLLECLEVFELPQMSNVVLLASELHQLQDGGNMRRSARLRALYSDRRRHNVLFDNLHHRDTAPGGGRAETRAGLALLTAAEWYYEHLGCRFPVVVLSDGLAQRFGAPQQQQAAAAVPPESKEEDAELEAAIAASLASAAAPPPFAEDAELDALLQQMHIGGTSSSSSRAAAVPATPAAPAAVSRSDDISSLLDSLGIGGDAQQQQQQQQQLVGGDAATLGITAVQHHAPLALEPGLHILSPAAYFGGCWGGVPAVADAFDSLQQARAEEAAAKQAGAAGAVPTGGARPHLSAAAMEAGLASGALLAGVLCVSRRVRGEATVAVGGGRQLLISGRGALNRAVHGDRVAVRLLPRDKWRLAAELSAGDGPAPAAGQEEVEDGDEHDLLATAGDGEADVAADSAQEASADGNDEPLDSVAALLHTAAAGALQPTAEVVGILQRWSGEIVACLAEDDERALGSRADSGRQESVLCIPTDRRLPKIRLRSRQLHRLLGQRMVLRLDGWEQGSHYPHGHLVRVLGPINSLTSETDGVLVSSGVQRQPFSEGALRELPPVASAAEYVVPPGDLAARRDLRGPEYLVCSIDPPGCTDVDDALSVRWLDDAASSSGGRRLVEVGVHIADVSFFVHQGGLLDSEAASRCTTVYLVDRRLDMLPPLLSEDLCSLRGGQDRFAVSVLWTLDADTFEVQDVWYGRTLIRSRYQLEYSQAQDLLEGRPPRTGHDTLAPSDRPALRRNLGLLAALAEQRRAERVAAGAVELESAELRFATDAGSGQPTTVVVKQEIPMMRIVAEMMILANAAVGRRIAAAFPRAALLRRHPPPRRQAFDEVAALCESLGSPLDFECGPAALSASLASAAAAAPPAVGSLIKSLATRAMSEAEYFCTGDVTGRGGAGWGHFGLALPFYTHFTSPIRRYADVVVHRQLLAAVAAEAAALPPPLAPPLPGAELADKAGVMNERHRTAKRAQKECSDLYLLLLLHSQPHVEAATVYGLRRRALLVFLPKYHLKGVIHLADKAGVCRPPLRQAGDEQLEDPFVLAYRRSLTVVAEGGEEERPQQLKVVEVTSGPAVATFRPMQSVWVQLSADGSRAHGPTLRMRLLADGHPEAQAAAAKEAAKAAVTVAQAAHVGAASMAAGCGKLPRPGAVRSAYRPPGIAAAAVVAGDGGRPALRGPPPGFGASAVAAAQPAAARPGKAAAPAAGMPDNAPAAGPTSLAAQLHALLDRTGAEEAEGRVLGWQADVEPLPASSCSSDAAGSSDFAAGQQPTEQAVRRALRRLQAKAARLQLRAGEAPGRRRAEACGAREAALCMQIQALQALAPG